MSNSFEDRLKALGLTVPPAEVAKLATLVGELDKAAEVVRGPRPYAEEPLSAFRLARAG